MERAGDKLVERIAELELEVEFLRDTNSLLQDHKEALKAENERLCVALVAIQSTVPGSAHRIAIQALRGYSE